MVSDLFGEVVLDRAYVNKLRVSMRGAIDLAQRRQATRLSKGKSAVEVTLTLEEAMSILRDQDYRCDLTRMRFYSLGGDSYGPSRPSLDRIEHSGPYSFGNIRVVFLGVNSLRGTGTDRDMYEIARALSANARI